MMEAASRAPLEPLSDDGLDMPSAPTPSGRKADDALPALEPLEPLPGETDPAAVILGLTDDLALPGLELPKESGPAVAAPATASATATATDTASAAASAAAPAT